VPAARLVRQRHGGVAAARNTAAREANGAYLCFTDDDCVPVAGWGCALARALRSGADVAAGPTLSAPGGSRATLASQLVTNWLVDPDAAASGSTRFAPGSNFACRRELLLRMPFDESYGLVGGEDRDWCARLAGAGIRIAYDERAFVLHEPPLTVRLLWGKYVRYGRAAWILRRTHHGQRLRSASHARLLRTGFRMGLGLGLLVALVQVATGVGALRQMGTGLVSTAGARAAPGSGASRPPPP
jgi:GT2 family glycosyltransferase